MKGMVNMYVILIDKVTNKILQKVRCTKENSQKIRYQLEINLDLTKYVVKIIE
ncbi:hypothetical protein ACFHWD_03690 [Clostridium sp. MT-14]